MEERNRNYDAIIIGFGKGGKTLAGAWGAAGQRTALIEQSSGMYGGTCINTGCIPAKFLVHKAQNAKQAGGDLKAQKAFYAEAIEGMEKLTGSLREKNYQKAAGTAGVELNARGGLQFTYISLDDYRIVRSAVLGDGSYTTKERGAVPYSVFLNPPFSRVGMSEQEAREKGYPVKVAKLMAGAIPKAQVLEQKAGILKAVIDEDTGLILGAHLFCEESHEMISLVKMAMDTKLDYRVLRDMIFTHPTMSEALNDLFVTV